MFEQLFLNYWEPIPTIGIYERIAAGIAEEIEKTIPCYVEGPDKPEDGWAAVHIDGLGNESVSITIWGDKIILAAFNDSLGYRKMRKDQSHDESFRRERQLCDPDSIDWIIRHALRIILVDGSCLYNIYDRDEKIRRLGIRDTRGPRSMLLGRPYYLI